MPREDVPYPTSAICSIRERIAELRDELDQLLKTVNGVAGDANHDIKLISDNAALGITNDAVQHEIHLDLDASQLPAALVDSVNGKIGTVVLDGDDLDGVTPGNSVNDDITALQGADVTLQGNINAEATARVNADSSLSTAINAALATIPGEVSSQIANNAAIIQLQNDVLAIPNKVDKRTGAGKFAYTHDGNTQGDIALVDGTTAATIPIRDANGRMQAADPASGATDKTLVTANWASQTGAGRPNNLIHDSGNEVVNGNKEYTDNLNVTGTFTYNARYMGQNAAAGKYSKIGTIMPGPLGGIVIGMFFSSKGHSSAYRNRYGMFYIRTRPGSAEDIVWMIKGSSVENKQIALTYDGSNVELWLLISNDPSNESLVYETIAQANANSVTNEILTIQSLDNPIVKTEVELSAYQEVTFSS